jgi:hypothetical protein
MLREMKIPFAELYESQRGDLTQRIRQMSDSELVALRERLAQGAVQDDSLRDWLEEDARHP